MQFHHDGFRIGDPRIADAADVAGRRADEVDGRLQPTDYEKVFCPDLETGPDIFDLRGINRDRGALIVVRPDQFIAAALPLDGYADLGCALLLS